MSYIILTKILVEFELIMDGLVSNTQTAFVKDRFIMKGVVLLHETFHEIESKKKFGVLL